MERILQLESVCTELLEACKSKDSIIEKLKQLPSAGEFELYLSLILTALLNSGGLVPSKAQPELYEVTHKEFVTATAAVVPQAQFEAFTDWLSAFEIIKINPKTGGLYHRPKVGKLAKFSSDLVEYLGGGQHG